MSSTKKGKSQKLPTNYRRITITSIVGKVIELHMVNIARGILDPMQSPYQFGFSKGCSPIYAALLLTEVVAEARDNKNELIVALMDTSKAFNVVSHTGMLNAMYTQGVSGSLWSVFNSMYTNIRSSGKMKCDGKIPSQNYLLNYKALDKAAARQQTTIKLGKTIYSSCCMNRLRLAWGISIWVL